MRNRIQDRDRTCIVLTLHQGIAQQAIDTLLVFGVRVLRQEIIERPYGLTQRTRTLICAQRIVIRRLFRYRRSELIAGSCLIRQFRLLQLLELYIRITHRQTGRFRKAVFLLLHLLERTNGLRIIAQRILRRTQHIHVVAQYRFFGLCGRFLISRKMRYCLAVVLLLVRHLTQDTMELCVVDIVRVSMQQAVRTLGRFVVITLRILDLRQVIRHGLLVSRLVFQGLQRR